MRARVRAGAVGCLATGLAVGAAALHAAPALARPAGPRSPWRSLAGVGPAGTVALTFDDGPDGASTPHFLDLLADRDVRATFFLLGEMARRFPDLPHRMVAEGHELAVHGWDHRNHLLRPPGRRTRDQLERTADLIEHLSGTRPQRFRPPYGVLSGGALLSARQVGLRPLLWTSWGEDWTATASPASVLARVTSGRVDGGTVLLHDSDCTSAPGAWRSALGALPGLLEWCAARGLRVGSAQEVHPVAGRPPRG